MNKNIDKYDTEKVAKRVRKLLCRMRMFLYDKPSIRNKRWVKVWDDAIYYNGNLHQLADRLMMTMLKVHGHHKLAKTYEYLCNRTFWFE